MQDSTRKNEVKFVSRIVSAGNSRKIIGVPANDLDKVQSLTGKPVLVILQPIL